MAFEVDFLQFGHVEDIIYMQFWRARPVGETVKYNLVLKVN